MAEVVMPRLSDSMEEGTILQWLKSVGDEIAIGDELVEIETDKANMAYESDVTGTLAEILVQEGETVAIGTPIATVGDSGEGIERSAAGPVAREGGPAGGSKPSSTPPPPRHPQTETVEAPDAAGENGRPKASPVARRIAKEKGLDLGKLRGSGPGGRIVKADVEKVESQPMGATGFEPVTKPTSSESPETAKGQVSYEELSKLQSTISRRMAESKATAPHFYLEAEVDMSRLVEARAQIKAAAKEGDVVPSFNDMVVKACALALREHPRANGAYRDGRFELYSRVNVGVAVAARDALVVPTVFDADQKNLRQIATDSRALAQRVRDGQITPPELSGATFTVSNLGMFGIDSFAAVINPPQAAILAVGAITERPVVRDGGIGTAHLMRVNLACDHRILYGAPAAEFLARIRALLEEPLALAL
ncbi:MAG TPA: dihydrolipoamide acetyltransferase family protein [Solirubrobacterales bacterium]|jgi:pyruvate dehydrogenase E2 component (dihydrolipoamide acetyltransferase)|nr:dihydrolipoamide acetyltransferase family protein [Solirubrobacterales bacterium]